MTPESSIWSRCTIVNLDRSEQKVEAYFNPVTSRLMRQNIAH